MWCYRLGTYQALGLPTTVFKKIRFHFMESVARGDWKTMQLVQLHCWLLTDMESVLSVTMYTRYNVQLRHSTRLKVAPPEFIKFFLRVFSSSSR